MGENNLREVNRRNLDFVVGFSRGMGVEVSSIGFGGDYKERVQVFLRDEGSRRDRYGFDTALGNVLRERGVESELTSLGEHSSGRRLLVSLLRVVYWPGKASVMDVFYSQI